MIIAFYYYHPQNTGPGPGSAPQGREMELEFEMENGPMRVWLEEGEEAKAIQSTGSLASQLFHLLNLCIPGEIKSCGREIGKEKGIEREKGGEIREGVG